MSEKTKRHDWRGTPFQATCVACGLNRKRDRGVVFYLHQGVDARYWRSDDEPPCMGTR